MSKPKKIKRGIGRTKLLMCEGVTDKRFAECLKKILMGRNSGFTVRLDEAGGGGPKSAILETINYAGEFDKRIVFIDSDLPIPKDALAAANNRNIKIIQSAPLCLEGFLMHLMGHHHVFVNSKEAKETFHRVYGLDGVVTERWYEENINSQLLQSIRSNHNHSCKQIVSELIDLFTVF